MQKRPNIEYVFRDLSSKFPFMASLGNFGLCPYNLETKHEFHDCAEFVYCHSGQGMLRSEERELKFSKGDILFLSPYTPHYLYKTGEEWCRCEFIHMDLSAMFDPAIFSDIVEFTDQLLIPFAIWPLITKEEQPILMELLQMLLEETRYCKPFYEMSIRGYCMSIVDELRKIWTVHQRKEEKDSRASLYPALLYMKKNYAAEISIPELADICHISETHFRRLFREKFRMSPIDYLNHIRIHEACLLLSRKSMLISEAAEETGYHTVSTFNRNFLKIMNTSPSEWMKQQLSSAEKPLVMYYG